MKNARRFVDVTFIIALALVTWACQSGGSSPANPSEAIGQAYALYTTAAHDVTTAATSGLISPAQTADYKNQLTRALANLDAAKDAYAAGESTGNINDRLATTQIVLHAIINAIAAQQGAKHGPVAGTPTT